MFASSILRQCRITLFTRATCGLCDSAKAVLTQVQEKRAFELQHVDLSAATGEKETGGEKTEMQMWRDLYDFDVPVIHVAKASDPPESPSRAAKAVKLMHRMTPADVEAKMDAAEKQ
ncbi:hypothetical protein CFIMG_002009RA [Ceratocystis fimbriata CBS 114723]|uniref:Glutaredoxin-like protein n=1 Tax=Ceratocystis fimbriata CBS 114723 TaxID=1035309 RepID=A0A2C5WWY2_9PEZI|nr:hypothetical protein CFIMG_002009RA [Ceratocystis fimbriata CBS 114723]